MGLLTAMRLRLAETLTSDRARPPLLKPPTATTAESARLRAELREDQPQHPDSGARRPEPAPPA